jgi:hypothetical protein
MEIVSICRLRDRMLIYPNLKTTDGVYLASEPYVTLELSSSARSIGVAVLGALADAAAVIPHPKSWSDVAAARLAAAGVKSERQFQLSSALVEVTRRNGTLEVSPTSNGGASGPDKGFHRLEAGVAASANDPSELGEAILQAFERCAVQPNKPLKNDARKKARAS